MTEIERDDEDEGGAEEAPERDPLREGQEGKGYGEDEGERKQSLDEDG